MQKVQPVVVLNLNSNCGIYAIRTPSEKFYIGSSADISLRWKQHLYHLQRGDHHNRHLQNIFNKYGNELDFELLFVCFKEDLLNFEQQFIDNLSPTLNICKPDGSHLGVKRSEETKRKLSLALTGKNTQGHPQSEESKKKLSIALKGNKNGLGNTANLGRKLSKETCLKMSLTNRGKSIPDWQKQFLSESRRGSDNPMYSRKMSDQAKEKSRLTRLNKKLQDVES